MKTTDFAQCLASYLTMYLPGQLPYGYVLVGKEIVMHEEKADVVRSMFEYYLAGASLGKIVNVVIPFTQPNILRSKIRKQLYVVSSLPCAIRRIDNRWRHSILLEQAT